LTEVDSLRTSSKFIWHLLAPQISCMVSRWVTCLNPSSEGGEGHSECFTRLIGISLSRLTMKGFTHGMRFFWLSLAYMQISMYICPIQLFFPSSVISPQSRKYRIFLFDCFSSLKSTVFLVHFRPAQFISLFSRGFLFAYPPT